MAPRKHLKVSVDIADELLSSCVARYGSHSAVAAIYAERFGCDAKGAEKVLRRIRQHEQPTVNVDTVDRLCILAGQHLAMFA